MLLVDQRATAVAPSSLFLTRAEFKALYPHKLHHRMDYVFRYDKPKEVENDEAKLLMKKYPHVIRWEAKLDIVKTERHHELEKLDYYKLKKLGSSIGMGFKEITIKREILIDRIVTKEIEIKQLETEGDEETK